MRWIWLVGMVVACGGGGGGETTRTDAILALDGDATAGATVFSDNCALCHAASGLGVDDGGTGTNLTEAAGETSEDAEFAGIILNGEGNMPAFSDLTDQEIADVLAYIHDGLIQ
jgi:mono/diheme cytochrome c family protein